MGSQSNNHNCCERDKPFTSPRSCAEERGEVRGLEAFSSELDTGPREENASKTKEQSLGSDSIRTDQTLACRHDVGVDPPARNRRFPDPMAIVARHNDR